MIYNYKNYNFAIALLFFFIDKNLKLILTLRPHRPILFHVEKYAKDIQGDSPLENPLPEDRATAVRVATLHGRTVLTVALAMRGILARDFHPR